MEITSNEIRCTNIIWIGVISKLGGVESFAFYLAKKYRNYDIMVLCSKGDPIQLNRIREYCPAMEHHGEKVDCKSLIINCDTTILDFVEHPDVTMVVHADYTQSCYKTYPNFLHPKITRIVAITKHIQENLKKQFNIEAELCYNPIVLEPKQRRLVIVSATRLSPIKGGKRMKQIAERLDLEGLNYIWYVFTNDSDSIHSNNVIFLENRLDVYKWLQEADIISQLSDTEADSYTIKERSSVWSQAARYKTAIP